MGGQAPMVIEQTEPGRRWRVAPNVRLEMIEAHRVVHSVAPGKSATASSGRTSGRSSLATPIRSSAMP